ncbi:MAG: dienelactone hydrolase-like enzyme [Acidimicrobiales bacterium]|nr:dienelactone hydrolase-like enzyme [Acidimicrobiales bacterium]
MSAPAVERTTLPSGTPAILARPEVAAAGRGVVLLPDIGGLRPLFDDLCARLAADHGWTVCAPEAWAGCEELPLEERLQSVGQLDDRALLDDALAAADLLGTDRVAAIGFCMGGMLALKAAGNARFDRIAAFYGMVRLPAHWRSPTMGDALDVLAALPREQVVGRVLAICGTEDPWVPGPDLDALEALGAEVARYRGADHAFVHAVDRPTHRPDDAADAWRRVAAWLA